jgi:hypothetical protein
MEARGDLAAGKLTTGIGYSHKVEFPTNLFGLPFLGLPRRATKNRKTKSTKGGGPIGIVYKDEVAGGNRCRLVCSSTKGSLDE